MLKMWQYAVLIFMVTCTCIWPLNVRLPIKEPEFSDYLGVRFWPKAAIHENAYS